MNINSNPSYSLRLDDKAESTVGAHHCTWIFKWMLMLIWYNAGLFHSNLTIFITSFSIAVIFYPFKVHNFDGESVIFSGFSEQNKEDIVCCWQCSMLRMTTIILYQQSLMHSLVQYHFTRIRRIFSGSTSINIK